MSNLLLFPSPQEAGWTGNGLQEMSAEGAEDHFLSAPPLECLPNSDSIHLLGGKPGTLLSIMGDGKGILEAFLWQD